jgi:hypothetical protein
MPILDIQRRFRELGRIRLGEQRVAKSGKSYPAKLETFRLTSPSEDLIASCAELYGGEVKVWENAPGQGRQWELVTTTSVLDVLVPPGEPLSQWNETWSGGGCVRRCDGFRNVLTDEPCQCPSDTDARSELAAKGLACKPTTRLSLILPRVPDVGVWRLESHGYNSAVELPGTVALLEAVLSRGFMLPAQLRLEARTTKRDGQTNHFVVPVLELTGMTMAALRSGEAAGYQQLEAPSAPAPAAIEPPKAPAPAPAEPTAPPAARTAAAPPDGPQRPKTAPPLPGEGAAAPTDDAFDLGSFRSQIAALPADLQGQVATLWKERRLGSVKEGTRFPLTQDQWPAANQLLDDMREVVGRRRARVNALLGEIGIKGDDRHQAISEATGGEIASSGCVTQAQLTAIEAYVNQAKEILAAERAEMAKDAAAGGSDAA